MPAKNRLRETDERVSIYLKIAIGAVTSLIIRLPDRESQAFTVPSGLTRKPLSSPNSSAKALTRCACSRSKRKLHLLEHAEYVDKPRGIVFRTDENRRRKTARGA